MTRIKLRSRIFRNSRACYCFFSTESWILYSGNEQGVSKSVRDAYRKYGNKEFGTKNDKIPKDDKNRHIKLISITNKKVCTIVLIQAIVILCF